MFLVVSLAQTGEANMMSLGFSFWVAIIAAWAVSPVASPSSIMMAVFPFKVGSFLFLR